MAKDLNMTLLFDFYHNMLTDKQADVIDLYYNNDLSLAEISEHLLITRQGVRDAIKRAEMIMKDAEENLGIAKRYIVIKTAAEKISKEIEEMETEEQALSLPWLASRLARMRKHLDVIKE
ncbi:MAG: DNA-binding protein [Firmicutes bacterium]|nr:DNA-binding protein [Bacillota bacterium]